ncbi:MAG: family 78 glycoside hydrolase catalytic domain [Acidimicrobiales bacterium]
MTTTPTPASAQTTVGGVPGALSDALFGAEMIAPAHELGTAPRLHRAVTLDDGHGDVVGATLHATAYGVFEAAIDGEPVSDQVLSPGWTAYEWRIRVCELDATALVAGAGDAFELAVTLGNGWWRGRLGFTGGRQLYGDRLGFLAALEITFADDHVQRVVTDEGWRAGASDVLADDLYDGQTIDARNREVEELHPGQPDVRSIPVETLEFDRSILAPYVGPGVVRHESRRPTAIWTSPTGRTLVDFGQNLVGWLRFTVAGPRGSEIRIRHAEVLEDGELGTRPLRDAQATDRFILSGADDTFEPTFTFHGFRYAEVSGWPGELTADDLEAVVVHSELERTGTFDCSEPLLAQLHRNVVWGLRGNFLDVPTDCPQRNERLGWTGDLSAFAPSAAFLYDVDAFLRDWLVDLALEQRHADDIVPFVVPDVLKRLPKFGSFPDPDATAIWGDAAVWVPWALYEAYGDESVLADQFASMAGHVDRIDSIVSPTGLWESEFQFGDWLDPDASPHEPWNSKADKNVVATTCLFRSASLVADAAEVLGRAGDAARFRAIAERTRAAFAEHYVTGDAADGSFRVASDCTTVYTLAIVFEILDDPAERQAAGDRLAELVRESGHRISTGFAGTPFITEALSSTGHLDDAYGLLLQTECPSWLYPVTMGATTVWERWDSMLPDGSINPGEMTSFNHYALGAVADWVHRVVGGIAPASPGYERIRIAPRPGGSLTWATTTLQTRRGEVRVAWRLADGQLEVDLAVPEGTTAELDLPGAEVAELAAGEHRVAVPFG